jgi:hypothetical protein
MATSTECVFLLGCVGFSDDSISYSPSSTSFTNQIFVRVFRHCRSVFGHRALHDLVVQLAEAFFACTHAAQLYVFTIMLFAVFSAVPSLFVSKMYFFSFFIFDFLCACVLVAILCLFSAFVCRPRASFLPHTRSHLHPPSSMHCKRIIRWKVFVELLQFFLAFCLC